MIVSPIRYHSFLSNPFHVVYPRTGNIVYFSFCLRLYITYTKETAHFHYRMSETSGYNGSFISMTSTDDKCSITTSKTSQRAAFGGCYAHS
jgi:hypothetical protein